jgi:hypothetical protein
MQSWKINVIAFFNFTKLTTGYGMHLNCTFVLHYLDDIFPLAALHRVSVLSYFKLQNSPRA